MRARSVLSAYAIAIALTGQAATHTWDGDTDDSWLTAANWDSAPTFNNTADIVIGASGASNLINYIGTDTTIRSLTWNDNTGSTSIQVGLQVSNSDTNAASLTFAADSGSATLTRTAGSTGIANVFSGAGEIVLGSDLIVSNTGGRMQFQSAFSETGGSRSVTLLGGGQILFYEAPTFTGNLNVEEGLVFLGGGTGSYGSTINLGKAGGPTEARIDMIGDGGTTSSDINVIADGAGAQDITIGKNGTANICVYSGAVSLNDDVIIRNPGGGRLNLTGGISGTGDITFTGANDFLVKVGINTTGDVTLEEGTLFRSYGGISGIGSGTIYVGKDGENTQARLAMASGGTTSNDIVVVNSGAGSQAVIIGKNATASSCNYTGTITLNDDVQFNDPNGGTLFFQNSITGSGNVEITGSDQINFNAPTDYTGDTAIYSSILDDNGHRLRVNTNGSIDGGGDITVVDGIFEFTGGTGPGTGGRVTIDIGANGVNNSITGLLNVSNNATARLEAEGNLHFDLGGADITSGNAWTVIGGEWESKTFSTAFNVTSTAGDFTEDADVWTLEEGVNKWTFSEATGELILELTSLPSAVSNLIISAGNVSFDVCGLGEYVVEAATDLAASNWVPVATNSDDFVFVDTNAVNLYPVRFYRVIP